MATDAPHLRLIGPTGPSGDVPGAHRNDGLAEDLIVVVTLFVIALVPLAGAAVRLGGWTQGDLGLATAGSLLAGRALWASAALALRSWRHP
jgi:hypothetical protein